MAQTQGGIGAKESWRQTENEDATRGLWQQLLGNVVSVGISFGICGLKRVKNLKRNKRKQGKAEGRGTRAGEARTSSQPVPSHPDFHPFLSIIQLWLKVCTQKI